MKKRLLLLFLVLPVLMMINYSPLQGGIGVGYNLGLTYQSAVAGPSGTTYIFYIIDGNLYVQAYDSSGNPLWGKYGILVSSKGNYDDKPHAIPDGQGGAIVIWYVDYGRFFGMYYKLFAQRIDQNGNLLWGPQGVLITELIIHRQSFSSISVTRDDEGGAYITFDVYQDWYNHPNPENKIYLQRISSNGERLFGNDGIRVAPGDMIQFQDGWHAAAGDGEGGVITAWIDTRYGDPSVIAQRFNKNGEALWSSPGVLACPPLAGQRYFPLVREDGSGGAIIAWRDKRPEIGSEYALFAQRVNSSGELLWKEDGRYVGIATTTFQFFGWLYNRPHNYDMISDGNGGAILSWSGKEGIFIQRLNGNGDRQWDIDGKIVSPYWNVSSFWQLMSGMSEGKYLITWLDVNGVYARIFDKDGNFTSGEKIIVSSGRGYYGDYFHWSLPFSFCASVPEYNGTGVMIFFEVRPSYWSRSHYLYAEIVNPDGTVGGGSSN